MQSTLPPLKQALAIRADWIPSQTTKLTVKQDRSWSKGDFTAKQDGGPLIFSCDGKLWSNSARKELRDATGLPLFSLRASWWSMSKAWRLELPGDGHMILAVRPRWSLGRVKLDCTFTNIAPGGEDQQVLLEVRGQDSQALVTHINHGEKRAATVRRVFQEGASWRFKPEYSVDVAAGMDQSLVSLQGIFKTECWDDTDVLGLARSLSL